MADDNKIKERIRKLLTLAENEGAAEGERDRALALATELITKHQIDRAMLGTSEVREEVTFRQFVYTGSYTYEKAVLLGWLADALGMRAVHWGDSRSRDRSHIYGFTSDLELLDMLYTSLLLQQTTGLHKAKVPRYLFKNEVAAWRRDWLRSFSTVVFHRVKAAHARAAETHDAAHGGSGKPGAAMVLANRSDQVSAAVEKAHPDLKKSKPKGPRKMVHSDAAEQGAEAGHRADIGLTKVGERQAQIGAGR